MTEYITVYIKELNQLYRTGLTTEHSFRPALQQLLQACTGFTVINEQSHIDCGAPDLTLLSKLLPIAYVEAKDLEDGDLDGRKKNKEQFSRYKESLDTIIFTDYLDFHLYEHGEWKQSVRLAEIQNAQSYLEHLSAKYPFGEITDPNVDNVDAADKYPTELQYDCLPFQLAGLSLSGNKDIFYRCITTYYHPSGYAEDVYYTHSNHLGSASWITDFHGDPVQYIHYAPYGELLASQHAYGSSYDECYKFTGKERDAESGYDYYGARYQIVPLGIWGSPDPLLDKTIHMSPYMYCEGNPINNVDPNGMLDGKMMGIGATNIAFGVAAFISGASIAGGTGGIAAPIGMLLIFDGYSSIGLGTSMFIYGLFSDSGDKNTQLLNTMPTSATNALSKSADIIAGTEHNQFEMATDALMIVVGNKNKLTGLKKHYNNVTTWLQVGDLGINVYKEYEEQINCFFETPNIEVAPNDITPVDKITQELPLKTYNQYYI